MLPMPRFGNSFLSELLVLLACLSVCGCVSLPKQSEYPTRRIATAPGPEDMVLDALGANPCLLIACDDRRCEQGCTDGWILRYDLALERMDTLLRSNEPAGMKFHPHGIDLVQINGKRYLYVVNHDKESREERISRYLLEGNVLAFQENIVSEHFRSPNAVCADTDGTVYVSNDAWDPDALGEVLFSKEKSTLVRAVHEKIEVVGQKAAFGNGVTVVNDALYHAATRGNAVYRYDLQEGELAERTVVARVTGPDNLRWDGEDLLVACHLRGLAFMRHVKNPDKLSPTAVYKVKTDGSEPELVFFDSGKAIPAGSTALRVGDKLYVSQVFEAWILEVDLSGNSRND